MYLSWRMDFQLPMNWGFLEKINIGMRPRLLRRQKICLTYVLRLLKITAETYRSENINVAREKNLKNKIYLHKMATAFGAVT